MDYLLLSDSTCDITRDMLREFGIEFLLPLSYRIDDRDYFDNFGADMPIPVFYNQLRMGKLSVTSLVNTNRYLEAFTPILDAGKDIVYLAFSSALSGSYQCAAQAADMLKESHPERHVYVIDSLCASMGEGLLLYEACLQKKAGLSASELAEWLENMKGKVVHWFTVDDMNFLYRGGRVSKTQALFGSMLKIKPLLHVSDEGKLVPQEKAMGRKKALSMMTDKIAERIDLSLGSKSVFISHGDCLEDAKLLAQMVKEAVPGISQIRTSFVGPVIGSHSGPGTLAIFCLGGPR